MCMTVLTFSLMMCRARQESEAEKMARTLMEEDEREKKEAAKRPQASQKKKKKKKT